MVMLNRILSISGAVILLLMFVIASSIPILDWLGYLSEFTKLTNIEFLLKSLLLLTGLIGSSLIIYWLKFQFCTARKISEIDITLNDNTEYIKQFKDIVYKELGKSRLRKGRNNIYRGFVKAIEETPLNAEICVTHFEKFYAIPYDEGDSLHEQMLMKHWTNRIKSGHLKVRQIVHISSQQDILDVRERIMTFENCPNFNLSVMVAAPPRPFMDLAIIENHWASIDFSSDPSSPYVAANSIEFYDIATIQILKEYFNVWWGGNLIQLKNKDGINWKAMAYLSGRVPESFDDEQFRLCSQHLVAASEQGDTFKQVADILSHLSSFTPLLTAEPFRKTVIETLKNSNTSLLKLKNNPVQFSKDQSQAIYLTLSSRSQRQLLCTSCGVNQSDFWRSDYGQRILELNKKSILKGIEVVRIFLIPEHELNNRKLKYDILKQIKFGIKVYRFIVKQTKKNAVQERDLMIIDDFVGFEYDLSNNSNLSQPTAGKLSIKKQDVTEMKIFFNQTKNLSEEL